MLRLKMSCVWQFIHYKRMILLLCYIIYLLFFVVFVLPSLVNKALCDKFEIYSFSRLRNMLKGP